MPKPNLSKRFIFGILVLAVLVGGIPLILSQSQVQQILSGNAWSTTQSASAICGPAGTAIINVRFTNQESSRGMIVTAVDNQTSKSVNLGTIDAGKTKIGEIDTLKTTLNSSSVVFNMVWADDIRTSDKRSASYNSVSKCISPSPTITPKPSPTKTPTPTPVPSGTPVPTVSPKPSSTITPSPTSKPSPSVSPTACPSPGTVKNVRIQCPYCTPSPSPNK